ncbi:hypothetical protein [Acrocarpospora pleiomorpha]|nr:hypothetical protein [Acrocarpospora pleiomorpha]
MPGSPRPYRHDLVSVHQQHGDNRALAVSGQVYRLPNSTTRR